MSKSRYTGRHLDLLGQYSPTSPLRVIALIDFDAFYAQCEIVRLGLPPATPLAVQQWNAIIALNYPARRQGLKRGASVDEAQRLCPGIVLQHVATWREGEATWAYRSDSMKNMSTDKSALDPYRNCSRRCFELIRSLLPPEPLQRVEKASVDEVFLDLSAQVHNVLLSQFPELTERLSDSELPLPDLSAPLDWENDCVITTTGLDDRPDWDDVALNIGAGIVREIRAQVLDHFQYTCSAGIACNKTLAKLAASFRKPNQQTTVLRQATGEFLGTRNIMDLRGLGGKLGLQAINEFGSGRVFDLLRVPLDKMQAKLGNKTGSWLYGVIRGNESSEVASRIAVQSMLSAKTFVPKVEDFDQASKWLRIFAADLVNRLNELQADHPRQPSTVALHHHINGRFGPTRSKQAVIPPGKLVDEASLFAWSKDLLRRICGEDRAWPCASLSLSLSGFRPPVTRNHQITSFCTKEPVVLKRSSGTCPDETGQELHSKRNASRSKKARSVQTESASSGSSSMTVPRTTGTVVLSASEMPKVSFPGTDGYKCPKCDQNISSLAVLEHLDWHFAFELHELGSQDDV